MKSKIKYPEEPTENIIWHLKIIALYY